MFLVLSNSPIVYLNVSRLSLNLFLEYNKTVHRYHPDRYTKVGSLLETKEKILSQNALCENLKFFRYFVRLFKVF